MLMLPPEASLRGLTNTKMMWLMCCDHPNPTWEILKRRFRQRSSPPSSKHQTTRLTRSIEAALKAEHLTNITLLVYPFICHIMHHDCRSLLCWSAAHTTLAVPAVSQWKMMNVCMYTHSTQRRETALFISGIDSSIKINTFTKTQVSQYT